MIGISRVVIIYFQSNPGERYEDVIKAADRVHFINSYSDCQSAGTNLSVDRPDIIVLDGSAGSTDVTKEIVNLRRIRPSVKILVVIRNSNLSSKDVTDILSGGAWGIIDRESSDFDITTALYEIMQGGAPISDAVATPLITSFHRNPDSPFTNRELEIITSLGNGKSYESIAEDLAIGVETVKTHVRHIYNKLQVNNKSDAIQKARHKNLI